MGITSNADQVALGFSVAAAGVTDWREGFRLLQEPWEQRGREMYRTKGSSTGTPWPTYDQTPESARYRYVKGRILGASSRGGIWRTPVELRWSPDKERLYPSLTNVSHPDAIFRAEPLTLAMGTRVPYAYRHDLGVGLAPEWAGGYVIPRRPLVALSREFLDSVREMMGLIAARTGAQAATGKRVGLSSADVGALL